MGRGRIRSGRRWGAVAVLTAATAVVALASGVTPTAAAATAGPPPIPATPSVRDVKQVATRNIVVPNAAARSYVPPKVTWPAAGSVVVQLQSAHATSDVAGLPVWLQAPESQATVSTPDSVPASIRISMADHKVAVAAGIPGVILSVRPTTGTPSSVRVGVDYGGFADAYGGGFGTRLGLVSLPACVLTTPTVAACRTETPLAATNDPATHTVSATVPFDHAPQRVIAATTSGPAGDGGGPGGTYSATSLKPSESWSAGGSTGSFDYSYPLQVPPAASSLVPTVSLNYDSGAVDGQTAATQSQSSWVGDGWSSSTDNFIEQSFVSCSDSPEGTASPSATNDSCYDGPILTLSLNGSTTSLLPVSGNTWKSSDDTGEVVTHLTNTNNGTTTYNVDYWTVTDRTGTVFTFGRNELPGWASGQPTTNSVQSEPVYSAHPNDPCYNTAGFAQSVCTMGYRWNLDYVKDLHGNAMAYYYHQDTNAYAQNGHTTSATGYVRDAHLDHIDYGFTDGNAYSSHAPDEVLFHTGDRCVSGTCDPLNMTTSPNWPDVPVDRQCTAGAACQVTSPSFYSTVRLTSVSTQQWSGTAYVPVDSWALAQHFPPTGDGYPATLWLDSITHTGSDTSAGGAAVTLPPVSFAAIALANRVDSTTDGLEPLYRYRISAVTSETGSVTGVSYELVSPCTAPVTLTPSTNTSSCFPVSWTPQNFTAPITDWFNKYVVQTITQADKSGGAPTMATGYTYLGGGAWHYDDNEVVQAKYRTWGQWRGYGEVQTRAGQAATDPQTLEDVTYYRGMDGDTLPGGATRSVTLTDSQGGTHADTDQLAGDTLEDTGYLGDGGPVDHSTITSYWVSAPTASRTRTGLPTLTANAVGTVETWTRQAITDTATTTWRDTETDTSYDTTPADPTFGLPTYVYRHGDLGDTTQRQCTTTTYAPPNPALNLVGLVAETEIDAQPCGGANPGGASAPTAAQTNALTAPTTLSRPTDVVSDTRTFYDNPALAASWPQPANPIWPQSAPSAGSPSVVRVATDFTGGAFSYQTTSANQYDSYGRAVTTWDANGHSTTTTYTMTNGLVTSVAVANAAGQQTTTTMDPERGIPTGTVDPNQVTTTLRYDGLGRLGSVWEANRPTTATANIVYTYAVSNTVPTVITTSTLNRENGVIKSTALYDSLLRPVQTQTPTPQGGRLVTNTVYDTHGWVVKKNNAWWDPNNLPNGSLVTAGDNTIPNQDRYTLDGLGRTVVDQSEQDSVLKQTTTTVFTGDRTITIPPQGGVTQSGATDALGRTTELDQYTVAPTVTAPSNTFTGRWTVSGGTSQATVTRYNNRGEASDVVDPAGDDWSSTYNLLGQVVGKTDPDAGSSTMTYDPAGNVTSTTDANGHTVSTTYDDLNRKTARYDAPVDAQAATNELAAWTYDGPATAFEVGRQLTATAYVGGTGGTAYTEATDGYTAFGESLGTKITIPATTSVSKDDAGQSTAVTTAGTATLAGTYDFGKDYDSTVGLLADDFYPQGGGLPVEDASHGYAAGLDLPTTLAGYASGVTYDAFGHVTQARINTGPNFSYLNNMYDPHTGLVTNTQVMRTATPADLDDTGYTYDPAGNITAQTETRQDTTSETQCFNYDQLDRLTQAWTATDTCAAPPATTGASPNVGDGITGGAYWTSWTLDPLGQRRSETDHSVTGGTDTSTTYAYDGNGAGQANTLTSTATTGPNGTSGTSYSYDKDGNTTGRTLPTGAQTLAWSATGQLATDTAGTTSSYVYDADGTQLLRQDGATTTLFLPNEQLVLNAGTQTVTGTRYIPLPGGGEAVRTGSGHSYTYEIATDLHGTSSLMLDSTAQNPTWRQFTPYGAPRGTATGSWPDQNGFLNKPTDTTTGLTAVGAREYDPTLGRFISLDPQFNAGSPQSLNGYTYADDNPVTASDPTGLNTVGMGCPDRDCHPAPGVNLAPRPSAPPAASNPGSSQSAKANAKPHKLAPGVIEQIDPETGQRFWNDVAVPVGLSNDVLAAFESDILNGHSTPPSDIDYKYNPNGELLYDDQQITQMLFDACINNPACDADSGFRNHVAVLFGVYTGMGQDTFFDGDIGEHNGEGKAEPGALQQVAAQREQLNNDIKRYDSCNSFSGPTPVLMANGTTKPISQIKVGDKIANAAPLAPLGLPNQTHTVTAIHVTYDDEAYTDVTITTSHGPATITGTAYHLYWDATTHTWTPADQLRTGDQLQTTNGLTTPITALHSYTTTMVTYNLTINTLHTYYVAAGNTPVLVHNDGEWDVPDDYIVVRGGQSAMPGEGVTFSGAMGTSIPEAAAAVPHGSIRITTAGAIRAAGGTVTYAPEPTAGGAINYNHVDVTLGESSPFGDVEASPVPKANRLTPDALGAPRC